MFNTQLLSEVLGADYKELVGRVAQSLLEIKAAPSMIETIKNCQVNDLHGLHRRLLKDARCVTPVIKRENFVNRVIALLNYEIGTRFDHPKRTFPKKIDTLATTDPKLGACASLVPVLIHRLEPGELKLALLLTHQVGLHKRSIFNFLEIGTMALTTDHALDIPISGHDNKHNHTIWLPSEALQNEVARCLTPIALKAPIAENAAKSSMRKRLTKFLRELVVEGEIKISPKDRSPGAQQLKAALASSCFDLKSITLDNLLDASRMYGVAANMPGDLRNMLEQTVLPASADRIRLLRVIPLAKPTSPNREVTKPSPVEKFMAEKLRWEKQQLEYLSTAEMTSEKSWVNFRAACVACVRSMTNKELDEKTKETEISKALYETHNVQPNSWWAWTVHFLNAEGKQKKWTQRTYREYLSLLLPGELLAFPYIEDVEEFDQEDLLILFDALESNKSADKLKQQRNLIWRMIAFAKTHAPATAFPEIEQLDDRKEGTLNKRAHILTPGELEQLISQTYAEGKTTEALTLILAGFLGMRPFEIIYLRKRDITLLKHTAEVNVMASKTKAGRRCLPMRGLIPSSLHAQFIEMLTEVMADHNGDDLFFETDKLRHQRRQELIQPAMNVLRSEFGNGIDMYTLRHGFASWCYLRASKLQIGGPIWGTGGKLLHRLFTDDLKDFAELVFYQLKGSHDPEVFYRICRLMGHATAFTTPKTYIHSAGLVHSAFLAR